MESQDQHQPILIQDHALYVSDDGLSILQDVITESFAEGKGRSAQAPESAILPAEVLQIIYKSVLNDNPPDKALLNLRLVCSGWKNAFDNYPILMDNFWWTVSSIPEFLNSRIATKVKNLRFFCGLSADQEQMNTFFKEIIPNVEGIIFDFPVRSMFVYNEAEDVAERTLFTHLISFAVNLKEIRVKSPNRKFLLALLNPKEIELVGCKIKNLFLNCRSLQESEIPVLKQFLFSLPKLCKLEVLIDSYCYYLDQLSYQYEQVEELINNVILPYIHTSPSSLKEMLFEITQLPRALKEKLALATIKYNLDIDFGEQMFLLNSVFEKTEEANVEINEHNCQSLKNCGLMLGILPDTAALLHKCNFCSKLRILEIEVYGVLDNNELQQLLTSAGLKHLNTLRLMDPFPTEIARIPNPDSMFLAGIPNLRRLVITGGIFNFFANFGIYFPNLVMLELRNIINIPADIFVSLGQMEKLNNLHIEDCYVTDQMFTASFQAEGRTTIPAIAKIKNLRILKLTLKVVDNLLTDVCLIDGITHNTTLEYLTLVTRVGAAPDLQFSEAGLNAIKATGRIKLTLSQE